jgi:hypothetical protein
MSSYERGLEIFLKNKLGAEKVVVFDEEVCAQETIPGWI